MLLLLLLAARTSFEIFFAFLLHSTLLSCWCCYCYYILPPHYHLTSHTTQKPIDRPTAVRKTTVVFRAAYPSKLYPHTRQDETRLFTSSMRKTSPINSALHSGTIRRRCVIITQIQNRKTNGSGRIPDFADHTDTARCAATAEQLLLE